MYSFSLTAPRVTEDEDRKEHEGLSPEEADAVKRDLYGSADPATEKNGFVETESAQLRGRHELAEAVEMLTLPEKADYLRALSICPGVVEKETNPLYFLRFDRWDPWKAAKRITRYWEMRREAFGMGRAFLPMVSTGHGALSPEVALELQKGMWIPAGQKDSHGRLVLYFDRPKTLSGGCADTSTQIQLVMYICTILWEKVELRHNGLIVLLNGTTERVYLDRKRTKTIVKFVHECCPFQVKAMHVFIPSVRPPFNLMLPVCRQLIGKAMRRRMLIHYGSTYEMLQSFANYGVGLSITPSEFGGEWKVDSETWLVARLAVESERERLNFYTLGE